GFGLTRFGEQAVDAVAHDFWNRRRARGDDRLAGGHGLEEDDPEAFLHAWQAENVAAVVFAGELLLGGVAEPDDLRPQAAQLGAFGAVAHHANFEIGQAPRGFDEILEALAAIEAADREHGEALWGRRGIFGEELAP